MEKKHAVVSYDGISFRIGDRRLFLHSGEIHYFRTHPSQWKDSLEKIKKANLNAISLYVPWNWHEIEEGELDFIGRTDPQRNLIGFLDMAQSLGLFIVLRPGPYICSEWLNGGIPSWLLNKHHEILALDYEGNKCNDKGMIYPVITYSHPTYLNYVQKWLRSVIGVVRPYLYQKGGGIINIQLDDEQSYWRILEQDPTFADYNPVIIGGDGFPNRFGAWLKDKYVEIDVLNRAFKTNYADFDAIRPPYKPLSSIVALPSYLEWYWFKLSEIDNYIKNLYMMVRNEGVMETISTLCHYLFAPMAWVKFTKFIKENKLDIILTNQYYSAPLFEISDMREDKLGSIAANQEIYRAAIKGAGTPPILMEIQSAMSAHLTGPEMEELYRLVIAEGIKGLNYYIFAGGENPPEFVLSNGRSYDISAPIGYRGEIRPHYQEIQNLGTILKNFESSIIESKPLSDTCIGFYEPYEACMNQGNLLDLGFRDDYRSFMYEYFNYFICRSRGLDFFTLLTHSGVNFDMEDIEYTSLVDLLKKPSLWVLGMDFMAKKIQEKLAAYVRQGGTLIMFPRTPVLDEYMEPCHILSELYGTVPINPQPARKTNQPPWFRSINFADRKGVLMFDYMDVFQLPPNAQVLAVENRTNLPSAFIRTVGKGKAVLIGFKLRYVWDAHQDHKAFIKHILDACGINRHSYSNTGELVVKESVGGGTGFLTVVNPVNLMNTGRITYIDPATMKQVSLPNLEKQLVFNRQGGTIMPLNVVFTKHEFAIVYSTAEILSIEENPSHAIILLRNTGIGNGELSINSECDFSLEMDKNIVPGIRMGIGSIYFPINFKGSTCSVKIIFN